MDEFQLDANINISIKYLPFYRVTFAYYLIQEITNCYSKVTPHALKKDELVEPLTKE